MHSSLTVAAFALLSNELKYCTTGHLSLHHLHSGQGRRPVAYRQKLPEQKNASVFILSSNQTSSDPHRPWDWWNVLPAFTCILWPSDKLTTQLWAWYCSKGLQVHCCMFDGETGKEKIQETLKLSKKLGHKFFTQENVKDLHWSGKYI